MIYDSQITAIIKQMDVQTPHSKYTRKERMRTIGTIDTYDFNAADTLHNQQNKQRNGSHMKTMTKSIAKKQFNQTNYQKHNKSLNSVFMGSRVRECTPKHKVKRLMSINHDGNRLKTDYTEVQVAYGAKKIVSELKKKLVFPNQDTYRLEAYKILKMVHANKDQQIYTAKMGGRQEKKYTLIKTNEHKARHYDRQLQARQQLARQISKKDTVFFLKTHNIWRDKKHYTVIQDNYLNPTWSDDKFYLFLNQFKTNPLLIIPFLQQLAAAIMILSKTQRAHSWLSIESVYFPLWRGNLKVDSLIKIGNLSQCIHINNKKDLLKMQIRYHTPPEVLNFILFEQGECFDRDYLQHISDVNQGWQIDVWSLGIMVLQLLNGGPLAGEGTHCHKLIQLQRELLIRYSYLLEKLDHQTHLCLSKMLSFHPRSRPHPLQVLAILSRE